MTITPEQYEDFRKEVKNTVDICPYLHEEIVKLAYKARREFYIKFPLGLTDDECLNMIAKIYMFNHMAMQIPVESSHEISISQQP